MRHVAIAAAMLAACALIILVLGAAFDSMMVTDPEMYDGRP